MEEMQFVCLWNRAKNHECQTWHWYTCKNWSFGLWRGEQGLYHSAMVMQPLWVLRISLCTGSQNSRGCLNLTCVCFNLTPVANQLWAGMERYSQKHACIPSDRQMLAGHILGQQPGVDRHLCSTSCAHLALNYPWHTSSHLSSRILLIWAGRESSALRTRILHRLPLAFSVSQNRAILRHSRVTSHSFLSDTIRKNTPQIQSTVDKVIRFYKQNHPKKSVF